MVFLVGEKYMGEEGENKVDSSLRNLDVGG
jgi:hypothetical protein